MTRRCVVVGFCLLAIACGPASRPPEIDPIDNQVAIIGEQFSLQIRASDADGDELFFSFSAPRLPNLADRAEIRKYDASTAVFTWTPLATDLGAWAIEFEVADGSNIARETIEINVVEGGAAPTFRQPTGSGTTLDLAVRRCLDLNIVVEDADSVSVVIAQEPPEIVGATLSETGPQAATWSWCPTQAQIDAQDRYQLVLSADDGTRRTLFNYLIVLKKAPIMGCPNTGTPPVVTHTQMDVSTVAPLKLIAMVRDDKGIKSAPLLYHTTNNPGATPNLGNLSPVTMTRTSGDMRNGTWSADVPNPVANMPTGSNVTVYYVIVAADDDDGAGACDHTTQAPATGTYKSKVTNPGTSGNLPPCSECTADNQCGGAADNCIRVGPSGTYCGKSCTGNTDCPTDYICSANPIVSVGGVSAKQCIPSIGTCLAITSCTDDNSEQNDDPDQADLKPELQVGTTLSNRKSCPLPGGSGDDEDWYRFTLEEDAEIDLTLTGGAATDLDVQLLDSAGIRVASGTSFTSTEHISVCLPAGTYYVRVYTITDPVVENTYSLSLGATNTQCAATCTDDAYEPDDDRVTATFAAILTTKFEEKNHYICANNEDWYQMLLFKDEMIYVSLTFEQRNFNQDIDLHFWEGNTDLTPCPGGPCTGREGQSVDSNEYFTRKIEREGMYYIQVIGYDGSENSYDICIASEPGQCPVYPQ